MNPKQTILLFAALVIFGGAGALLLHRDTSSWNSSTAAVGEKALPAFDLNQVAQVEIKSSDADLHLVRKDGIWTVLERYNYPANFEQVGDLIRKLWELKVTEEVPVGASQLGRLNLVEPAKDAKETGTVLDLKDDKGQRIAALLLGKMYLKKSAGMMAGEEGFPAGRYVMALDGRQQAALVGEPFTDVQTAPDAWLDHDFFKVEKPQSISVKGAEPDVNWVLTKEKADSDWALYAAQPDEKLDVSKASTATAALDAPSFADVRPAGDQKDLESPSQVTVRTFDGFAYDLKIGKLEGEQVPMTVEITANLPKARTPDAGEKPDQKTKLDADFANQQKALHDRLVTGQEYGKWVYLMPKSWAEQLLAKRETLLQPKPTPAPAPSPGASPSASATPVAKKAK